MRLSRCHEGGGAKVTTLQNPFRFVTRRRKGTLPWPEQVGATGGNFSRVASPLNSLEKSTSKSGHGLLFDELSTLVLYVDVLEPHGAHSMNFSFFPLQSQGPKFL